MDSRRAIVYCQVSVDRIWLILDRVSPNFFAIASCVNPSKVISAAAAILRVDDTLDFPTQNPNLC
jgi:hypothetical protein